VNAPANVFEYDGMQYVAVYSGGSLFAGAPRGDSVFLFSLTGTLTSGSPSAPPAAPPTEHR
jgi:hypothetical protein